MTIKVLVVDDSALIRSLLKEMIESESDMVVVGTAPDAFVAKQMILQHSPDVITLDIEMPKVDGLRFLEVMMKAKPTPTIMISTLTEERAEATLRALSLGAVDFIPKPKVGVALGIEKYQALILEKIRIASRSKVRAPKLTKTTVGTLSYSGTEKIVAIGASTGGTEAIREVLEHFPANAPATVITQHMPAGFTKTYAQRLDQLCQIRVKEVANDERLLPGNAYLAPGDKHIKVYRSGADYRVKVTDGERVSGHKPSVDVMFSSLAECAGKNVIAALLTGMGKDGAQGLKTLKNSGAYTLCQNEQTCVVYGMPKVAMKLDAVCEELPLDSIPHAIITHLQEVKASSRL